MTALRPARPAGASLDEIARLVEGHIRYGDSGVVVTGVELSSTAVQDGDLFVALPGKKHHGANFVDEALARGATAVLTDESGENLLNDARVPIIVSARPRELLGEVAATVYGSVDPGRLTFGVTGTNGKTSIVYCLASILESLGRSTALSTTALRRIGDKEFDSSLTTPEATELHAFLALAREAEVRAAALEVSAHAMSRHRIAGIHFDVVAFANFSHDHLDDYDSMEDYFAAKAQLFTRRYADRAVVVVDDDWGQRLRDECDLPVTTIASQAERSADWHVSIVSESFEGTTFRLHSENCEIKSRVPVLGAFMAVNAAIALLMLIESGVAVESLHAAVSESGIPVVIPGRLEIVSGDVGPVVIVDYGHTPEAFRASLEALRRLCTGRIFMVFGADGDRDKTKRPELGAIAARLADIVIVTDFHPRSEDPAVIRAALLTGARAARPDGNIREIADPGTAVRAAIKDARAGDVVLYAGPGHETYREQAGLKIPYDARADVRAALDEAGYPPRMTS